MAAPRKGGGKSAAELAKRMNTAREPELTPEQGLHQRVLQQRKLWGRNALMALSIALFSDGYTIYRISQERFLDELEQEVETVRAQSAKTPAN